MRHPNAKLIAHPECEEAVLRMADFIGSTTALLKYTKTSIREGIYRGNRNRNTASDEIFSPEKFLFLLRLKPIVPVMIVRI